MFGTDPAKYPNCDPKFCNAEEDEDDDTPGTAITGAVLSPEDCKQTACPSKS